MEVRTVIPYRIIGKGVEPTERDMALAYAAVITLLSAKLSGKVVRVEMLIALEWTTDSEDKAA